MARQTKIFVLAGGRARVRSGEQPAGLVIGIIIIVIGGVMLFVLALLFGAGFMLGIYLPLIPYFLFLFGGLAWLILVIEALIASPLIALTLIIPNEDEIGKAGHALVLLVSLFLRPALMIVGFVIASKLLMVSVRMLNYGFTDVLYNSLGSFGLFGSISLVVMYAGLFIAFIHEAFSLIYVLPDKAIRWMGGTQEQTGVSDLLKKAEQASEKGGQVSDQVAKGAIGGAMKGAQKATG